MSKPYDAAGKELLQSDPAAWAALLGAIRPADKVEVIDSDLSTITAAADRILRIKDDPPWLINVEFQSWRDPSLPWQLLKYNALLHEKHGESVATVLVLLAKKADSPAYNGRLRIEPPLGPSWEFAYTVVRVWELSAEAMLTGPLALLPLAPVADVPLEGLPSIFERVESRLRREANPEAGTRMLVAMSALLQLRYGTMLTTDFTKKHPELRQYTFFQPWVDEGMRESIRKLGVKKFGMPTPDQEAALLAIDGREVLGALSEKLLDVDSWDALLSNS